MSLPNKDFDQLPEQDSTPSCEFTLGGRKWHCRNATTLAAHIIEEGLRPEGLFSGADDFFRTVIVTDEVDEFMVMAMSSGSPLTVSNVRPLMSWITEQLSKRPTKRPSSSTGGLRTTARKSGDVSSSPVTPKRR